MSSQHGPGDVGSEGEIRLPRVLGVFAVGRIINPKTARSQLLGGMTMGLSMALHEESVMDAEFGDYLNHDFAQYHIASCADVEDIDAIWLDEDDDQLNPMGSKGIGEIGIVGGAAAVANAVFNATGVRVRDLPIRPDKRCSRQSRTWTGRVVCRPYSKRKVRATTNLLSALGRPPECR